MSLEIPPHEQKSIDNICTILNNLRAHLCAATQHIPDKADKQALISHIDLVLQRLELWLEAEGE